MQKRRTVFTTLPRAPPPLTTCKAPGTSLDTAGAASPGNPAPLPPGRVASQPRPSTWQLLSWGRFLTRIFLRLLSSRRIRCSRAATSSGCSAGGAGRRASPHVSVAGPGPRGPDPGPSPGPAEPPRPAPPSPPPPAAAIFPAPRGSGLLGRLEGKQGERAGGGRRGLGGQRPQSGPAARRGRGGGAAASSRRAVEET